MNGWTHPRIAINLVFRFKQGPETMNKPWPAKSRVTKQGSHKTMFKPRKKEHAKDKATMPEHQKPTNKTSRHRQAQRTLRVKCVETVRAQNQAVGRHDPDCRLACVPLMLQMPVPTKLCVPVEYRRLHSEGELQKDLLVFVPPSGAMARQCTSMLWPLSLFSQGRSTTTTQKRHPHWSSEISFAYPKA